MELADLQQIQIEKWDEAMYRQVKQNWDLVAKPLDSLGQFETLIAKIGAILGTAEVDLSKKAVIAMCADNGIVEEHVSQSGQEVTEAVAACMGRMESSVGKMARKIGADVIPVDIGINTTHVLEGVLQKKVACGTRNFLREPAMTEEQTLAAIEIGMNLVRMCKEKGYTLLATGEMGIGNTTTSSAVAAALLGCEVEAITGRGAGLSREGLNHKIEVIKTALRKYELKQDEPLRALETVGGLDLAGLVGVFLGGAVYHIPVVLDGVISAVAALTAERLVPGVKNYMIPSHAGKEPATEKILQELSLQPVIRADLALGEGTGAVMMFALLDMAMALYDSTTTFQAARIEQYERYQ
jgi:nicotinate-nucleotide--dimethylbenzimidazole phosphoribosyltransferase